MKLKKILFSFLSCLIFIPIITASSISCSNNAQNVQIKIITPKYNQFAKYIVNNTYVIEGFKVKTNLEGFSYVDEVIWSTNCVYASMDEKGNLTITPIQKGVIHIKIIAKCPSLFNLTTSTTLQFKVYDSEIDSKSIRKVFPGLYLGLSEGTFTLEYEKNHEANAKLVNVSNFKVNKLDFNRNGIIKHENIQYCITSIGTNALQIQNYATITFPSVITSFDRHSVVSTVDVDIIFLHNDFDGVFVDKNAFSKCKINSFDLTRTAKIQNCILSYVDVKDINYISIVRGTLDKWKKEYTKIFYSNKFVAIKDKIDAKELSDSSATGYIIIGWTNFSYLYDGCSIHSHSGDFSAPNGLHFTKDFFKKYLTNNKIENISDYCFKDCVNLRGKITLYNTFISEFGKSAFENTNIQEFLFYGEAPMINKIPTRMFMNCKNLEKVNLGVLSINEVGDSAFEGCSKLHYFSSSSIDDGKASIIFFEKIGNYAFKDCAINSILMSWVEKIGVGVFMNCKKLSRVQISDAEFKLTTFPKDTFRNCYKLEKISPTKSISKIEPYAFASTAIEELNFPNVEIIGDYAFENCFNLKKVVLGNNSSFIGTGAFNSCTQLESIYIKNIVSVVLINNTQLFTNIKPLIYVPDTLYDEYVKSNWGKLYLNYLRKHSEAK